MLMLAPSPTFRSDLALLKRRPVLTVPRAKRFTSGSRPYARGFRFGKTENGTSASQLNEPR
jgi:hypothetical protein